MESGDLPSSSDEEMQSYEEQIDPYCGSPSYVDQTYTMFDTDAPLIRQDDFASDPHFKSELKAQQALFPPAISQLFNLSNVKQEPLDIEMTPEQGLPFLQTIKREPEENTAESVVKPEPENLEAPGMDNVDGIVRTEETSGTTVAINRNEEPSASNSEHMLVTVKVEPDQPESETSGLQKINTDNSQDLKDEALRHPTSTQESTVESSPNDRLEKRPVDVKIGLDSSSKLTVQVSSDQSFKVPDKDKTIDNPISKMSDDVEIASDAGSTVSAEVQIESNASSKVCGEIQTNSVQVDATDTISKVSDEVPSGSDPSANGSKVVQIVADPGSMVSRALQIGSVASSKSFEEGQIDSNSKVTEECAIVDVLSLNVPEEEDSGSGSISKVAEDDQIGPDSSSKVSEKDSESTSSPQNPVVSNESLSKKIDENCQSDALDMSAINSDDIKNDGNPQS